MVSVVILLMVDRSSASAEAARGAETVILVQPAAASPALHRSLARIRDEISADRFRVVLVDSSTTGDPEALIESAARDADGGSVLVLFGDPEAGQVELCVVRRAARHAAVRRAMVVVDDPERTPEVLAARALELLRATALELSIETEHTPRAQAPPDSRAEADIHPGLTLPAPATAGFAVEAGLGVWNSVDGPPAAVAPVGRIALHLSEWAWVRVSVAGLGSRPRVATAYGSATLAQAVALLECAAVLRRDRRIRPTFSLGAGALNVAVFGTGAAPYEGREPQRWSAALDAGAGVAVAVGSRAALVAELHALLAAPHPVVRFADTRAATVGYPSLILTLALRVAP
jgi:hypothetical protein